MVIDKITLSFNWLCVEIDVNRLTKGLILGGWTLCILMEFSYHMFLKELLLILASNDVW